MCSLHGVVPPYRRAHRGRGARRSARPAAALLLGLLWPGAGVWANSGTTHSLRVSEIRVKSDAQRYIGARPFDWSAVITIDAGTVGRIKRWEYWPELRVRGQWDLGLKPFAASRSYSVGDRPDRFHGSVGTQVSGWPAVDSWAIMACNRQASALRSAGWSDERIFEEEHKIAVRAVDKWDVEFTVDDYLRLLVEGSHWFTEIVCEPGPGTPAGQSRKPPPPPRPPNSGFAVPFQISAATVSVGPARTSGPCPMELAVAASLTAVGGGTASFRMVHNGPPGPVRKVTFSQGGTRTDTATFTVGAPSGGPALATPTGSGGGIGGLQTPTQPGQHDGHFAIQVVAPNALASDQAFYSVTCTQPPAPQGLKALGSVGPGAGSAGRQPGPRPVAGFGQLAGPTVDAQVPRRALGAGGRWQVRARSLEPPGPWSGWTKLPGDWDGDC